MGPPRPVPLPERPPRGKLRTDSTYDWREIGEQVTGLTQRPGASSYFASRDRGKGERGCPAGLRLTWGIGRRIATGHLAAGLRRRGRLGRSNSPRDGQISRLEWKSGDGCKPRRMTHGTNWPARQTLYGDTAGRAGIAYCGTTDAAAAQQRARQPASR